MKLEQFAKSFEHVYRDSVREHATFSDYRVSIMDDQCASNPWEEWDCEPPIYIRDAHRFHGFGEFQHGVDLPALTRAQIVAGWRSLLPDDYGTRWRDLRRYIAEYRADDPGASVEDAFNLRLKEDVENLRDSEKLDQYAAIFQAAGIPAGTSTVNGSCQSQWAEVLVVLTPDWQKLTGCTTEDADACESNLKHAAKLYEAWAFGDVVGFKIEKLVDDDSDEWEDVDSCWGFYGHSNCDRTTVDYSGVYAAALEAMPENAFVGEVAA